MNDCDKELVKSILTNIILQFQERVRKVFRDESIEFWLEQKRMYFGWE